MSAFLGFESYLISLGSSIEDVKTTLKSAITSYGWQVISNSVTPLAVLGTITTPANALDGSETTAAGDSAALPRWVGVQMTVAFTPVEMIILNNDQINQATVFSLDWSDNGSAWTVHQSWTDTSITWRERRKFVITAAPAKNYWRLNITAGIGTYKYIAEWRLRDSSNNTISNQIHFDVIPPVTETIGDGQARDIVRFVFTAGTIYILGLQELLTETPAWLTGYVTTGGALTTSMTIGGQTVSYVGQAGDTTTTAAKAFVNNLRTSALSNFVLWDWTNSGNWYYGKQKTPATVAVAPTVANLTSFVTMQAQLPGIQMTGIQTSQSVTTDLVNGFVYYLQVNARGIALATKTNVSFYGPIHACYGENAQALAQVPSSDSAVPNTVAELVVGVDDVAANTGGSGRFTHYWVCGYSGNYTQLDASSASTTIAHPFTKSMWSYSINDATSSPNSGYGAAWVALRGEGLFTGNDSGSAWPVHRLTCDPDTVYTTINGGSYSGRGYVPVLTDLDWYRYTGTLNDEQMVIANCSDFITTLTSDISASDTTINVASTTGFPVAGYILISGEMVQYTSKTGTSFTGCTRAKYSTLGCIHYVDEAVYISGWFVKINTGLLFAGYQKPV